VQKSEYWGEPKNKNPLEKTTIAHDPELADAGKEVGDGVGKVVKDVGDKLKEMTGGGDE